MNILAEKELDRLETMLSTLITMVGNAKSEQTKLKEQLILLEKKVDLIEK